MVVIGSAGVVAPGKWRPLRALGWLAVLCVASVLVFNAVAMSVVALVSIGPASPEIKLLAAVAASVALILFYWLAVRLGERRRVPELALRRAPSELVAGLDAEVARVEVDSPFSETRVRGAGRNGKRGRGQQRGRYANESEPRSLPHEKFPADAMRCSATCARAKPCSTDHRQA
jgi:type VI protein secretion system component VasK